MDSVTTEIFERYFGAYSAHAIEIDGVLYPTAEHAYHCQRYTDPTIVEEIRSARSPYLAWAVSQTHKAQQKADFSERKVTVMEQLCRHKLQQHADVRQALLDTKDAAIHKRWFTGSPADGFWDVGMDGTGANESGKIWMRLREELSDK
jgi:N-glycosidase YbiA